MRITSYGAAQTVTGSCHLVEASSLAGEYKLLLDCGAYQGAEDDRNAEPFGFEASRVDAVVISHAHHDHIGRLPVLVRQGYRGQIYLSEPTMRFLPVILEDSLRLMTEEHQRWERTGRKAPEPLWDQDDLNELYRRLEPVPLHQELAFGPFTVRLRGAGHLPGSAFIEVQEGRQRLVFSGDLGNRNKEVLPDPEDPPPAELVLCEGTYGDRPHRPFDETIAEFARILSEHLSQGGKVFIPSFALERTQEVLYHLRKLEQQNKIPSVPIYVDSPMAERISQIYPQVKRYFSPEVQALYEQGTDPFSPRQLRYAHTVDDSKALNELSGPLVIVAGNGMLSGGRILHHLRHGLSDPKNALVITSYQPRGGLGRILLEGAEQVRMFGEEVRVKAQSYTLGGFSGHAGQDELLDWLRGEHRVALVHGEPEKLQILARALGSRGQKAMMAEWGKPIEV
ncbi:MULTISPECIES: MBL fold metallo-hydrolase [unclassified Meiothermus]|uniref:MBL fold metallo-hydrolase n=1 Tax=unclassified Meiothermus TaxID=370471 RepID=UPI000D7BEC98|nr:MULTISPECIES: MBL fold metallo-hydrolase [unclassified Meiothermus]PZA05681.1 MBL fold metallo-hydrolase [Meiothermus sp. Pnk-1]RYM29946.1 MBL fold metallo-hydrolase [Meiothermus sp. PNK-Is4]